MTTTTIPAEPGWRFVIVSRPPGGGEPVPLLRPVLAWLVGADDQGAAKVSAVILGPDGRPQTIHDGRYVSTLEQSNEDYAATLAAAVAEYRAHEAAVLDELVDHQPATGQPG